ncbi:MAG: type II toxin-antitoxin system YoeB family toxin [Bacteroidales bacterium]|nr:type II toxin-antitoxin system YoeB family toxin [Bacteroidales bacterium]MCF8387528.1 type II toxin-antitoxin system YoeB family toxin [Bacteroidales bacterium]MCF8398091.1 type II toxin-antitoxin system YoeB family toxin [Bacteroidales bacterium]
MVVTFSENAWEDYLYWQKADKKILKEINNLIKLDEYKQDQL